MNQEQQPLKPGEEPEFFDRAFLGASPAARLEYFEQHCLIEHPRQLEALESILEAICAPSVEASSRRPGTMVLVIGPARVGKTTLIRLLEERLLAYATAQMQRDPTFIPLASLTAPEPGSGRFDWADFYRPVLRQLGNPFVDSPTHPIRARQLREATEAAYRERRPLAIIVDEAHHLARARSGQGLHAHLDHYPMTGYNHEPLLRRLYKALQRASKTNGQEVAQNRINRSGKTHFLFIMQATPDSCSTISFLLLDGIGKKLAPYRAEKLLLSLARCL